MKTTLFYAFDNPTIEEIEDIIKSKLGDKYTYKSSRKKNSLAGKLINGSTKDSITVIKNAYHRYVVSVETNKDPSSETGKTTVVYFNNQELAGWLKLLYKEAGFIGQIIIGLIYGKSNEIYDDVIKTVKTNLRGEDKTYEVGLGAFFKKNKSAE